MKSIGIVAAMRVEARCITPRRLPFNEPVRLGEGALIWLCGMGGQAAARAAEGLHAAGANALMSFGLAGALDSTLRPGSLILPEYIQVDRLFPVDLLWRDRLRTLLPNHISVVSGTLAASRHVLTSATAKRALAQTTGACAVDMESGAIAEVAERAGLPFLAVRAISDPIEFSPPSALLDAIRPDGSVELGRLLGLLLRGRISPRTLLRLAVESRAACSTLATVVRFGKTEIA
ncbi:MAG: phosphorylase [Nitrosospira sp. 56-18]|nr:phosphorylase [Nitrosospira sp.]OJY14885.1 MAG: phosphorylase [Nitrosospira sp. 56-18]